jgi:hypothetical protein
MSGFLKLALVLTGFFFTEPSSWDPDVRFQCHGNPVAICDSLKRELIPAKYSQIDYVGYGLFIATSVNPLDRYVFGTEKHLFNNRGVELAVKVPEGGKFAQVSWLGAKAELDSNLVFEQLPPETIIRFSVADRFGLCDLQGNVVLPAKYANIWKAHGGKAFVAESTNYQYPTGLSLFDCVSKKLQALPDDRQLQWTCAMSEGLAVVGSQARNSLKGYVDATGKFKIEPKYKSAGPFINGRASVVLADVAPGKPSHVQIDKSGQVTSPVNLDLEDFYGDCAIAHSTKAPEKFGVVNHQFEYVVPPIYSSLEPQARYSNYSILEKPSTKFLSPPQFYIAKTSASERQQLVSPTGRVLLTMPEGHFFNKLLGDSILCVWVQPLDIAKNGKMVFMNLLGQVVTVPLDLDLLPGHDWYQPIAPSRLLKTVSVDDGKFDSSYWKAFHHYPIQRYHMFARFLKDFDLIGMDRKQLLELLGPENDPRPSDSYSYALQRACSSSSPGILIQLKGEKVESWRYDDGLPPGKPITTNVLLVEPVDVVNLRSSDFENNKPKLP